MKRLRHRVALAASLAMATAAAVAGWQHLDGWPDHTTHLRDDAFYEFVFAANLAAGHGPTVSDGVTTSGVQLLWSLLLALAALCCGAEALPVLAPGLGMLCHAAVAVLLLSRRGDRAASLPVALWWLGNPLLLRECQNGQETALAVLLLWLLWRWRATREVRFFAIGLLAVLARNDLFAALLLLSLGRHGRQWWWGLPTPLLVLGLHGGCCRLLGGGFLPDSGLPMAWLAHANFAATVPTASEWLQQVHWYLRPVLLGSPFGLVSVPALGVAVFQCVRSWWPARWNWLPVLLVSTLWLVGLDDVGVALVVALLLLLLPTDRRRLPPRGFVLLVLGAWAILWLHWALRWYPRDYYAAPLAVVGLVALQRCRRMPWLLLLVALWQLGAPSLPREPLRGQALMALAGDTLPRLLPAGERVGCFNSGLLTYHGRSAAGGPLRVVNCDGVVDARAFVALREQRLDAWLDEQGIRFLVDDPRQFALDPRQPHACGRWFGADFRPERDLVEVARFVIPGLSAAESVGHALRLYWRAGRGTLPLPPARLVDGGAWGVGGRVVIWPAVPGDTLQTIDAMGQRRVVCRAEAMATHIVGLTASELGDGRLYLGDAPQPVWQPDRR